MILFSTGTHQFPAMQRLIIQKSHAFMLLYSITSKKTLEDLKPIYDQIREIKANKHQQFDTPILLMGCKVDQATYREVTENYAKQLATQWSCAWIETSAKMNTNIREAFQELLKLDKKRQFNFNVDQDGHLIDENDSTTIPSSPSFQSEKKTSTITDNGSNPDVAETTTTTTDSVTSERTPPSLQRRKTNQLSTSSINAKTSPQTVMDRTDLKRRSKRSSTYNTSSNRASTRGCFDYMKREKYLFYICIMTILVCIHFCIADFGTRSVTDGFFFLS